MMADKEKDEKEYAAKKKPKPVPNIQQLSGQFAVASDGTWYTLSAGQMTEETEHGVVTKPCVTLTPVPVQVADDPGTPGETDEERVARVRAEQEEVDRKRQARAVEESKREREDAERRAKEREKAEGKPEPKPEPQPAVTGVRR